MENNFEFSALFTINSQRKRVAEKLNNYLTYTVALKGGNEEKARTIFEDCLATINIASMLDILTNEEHDMAYQTIYDFFSGKRVCYFVFEDLTEHYFADKTTLDLMLLQKINIQEQLNINLQGYREFGEKQKEEGYRKPDYLIANERMVNFASEFGILKENEVLNAKEIIKKCRKNDFSDKKIIFVPENFYEKI